MKIKKLDDLKNFKGNVGVNLSKLYDFVKINVEPSQYSNLFNILNETNERKIKHQIAKLTAYQKNIQNKCFFIEGENYADALYEFNNAINELMKTVDENANIVSSYLPIRQNTLKENIIARIENSDNFSKCLESCSAVAYKPNLRRQDMIIKISPLTKEFINFSLDKCDYENLEYHQQIDYDFFDGEEIERQKVSLEDQALIALGGINKENKELLKEYNSAAIRHVEKFLERKLNSKELMDYKTIDFDARATPKVGYLCSLQLQEVGTTWHGEKRILGDYEISGDDCRKVNGVGFLLPKYFKNICAGK